MSHINFTITYSTIRYKKRYLHTGIEQRLPKISEVLNKLTLKEGEIDLRQIEKNQYEAFQYDSNCISPKICGNNKNFMIYTFLIIQNIHMKVTSSRNHQLKRATNLTITTKPTLQIHVGYSKSGFRAISRLHAVSIRPALQAVHVQY